MVHGPAAFSSGGILLTSIGWIGVWAGGGGISDIANLRLEPGPSSTGRFRSSSAESIWNRPPGLRFLHEISQCSSRCLMGISAVILGARCMHQLSILSQMQTGTEWSRWASEPACAPLPGKAVKLASCRTRGCSRKLRSPRSSCRG